MKVIVHLVEQRSQEWYQCRLGRLCGSNAADIFATRRDGKEAAARYQLRTRLMLERITSRSQERNYVSAAMLDGIDREFEAAQLYEALTGRLLTTVGFCEHPDLMAGCSPDGLIVEGVDLEGIIEAKSPLPATHLEYLKTGVVPTDYYRQCLHNLWITGAKWCDWFSYQPDFPEPLRVKLVRIVRNETDISAYELLARNFLKEVDDEVETVRKMMVIEAVA